MLCIATDLKDNRWLQYIFEEFSRINMAEFPIQVHNFEQGDQKKENIIYYNRECSYNICIPNRSYVRPWRKVQWLSKKIFIIKDTFVNDWGGLCNYDIFWNAFVFLSRLEEYQSEENERKIHSYSRNHPRIKKSTFDVPVVNHLFDELERLIKQYFPALPFGNRQKPMIELSHDVDYVDKTIQLKLKHTAFNGFNTLKAIASPTRCICLAQKTLTFLFSNPSYWCFDYWEKIEKKHNVRSVFYVYVKTRKKSIKSWLLDPSYDVATNSRLKKKFRQLIDEGFEIGLHGSFCSATDDVKLSEEKTVLEEIIETKVDKVRQHWLRYEERETPYIHANLFKYDSSLGWNDRMGFRSGIAGRYRPYDHMNNKPFNYMITPQVIMDANIYDYGADDVECLSKKAINILEGLCKFKSAYVSISWHQRVCSSDYGWHGLYEKVLSL